MTEPEDRELRERGPEKCWTCGGHDWICGGHDSKNCICGCTGLHAQEVQNMREELLQARRREVQNMREELLQAWRRQEAAEKLAQALLKTRHDLDCHPSEGRHSKECFARRAALAAWEEANRE
jgi:hypothetical protein